MSKFSVSRYHISYGKYEIDRVWDGWKPGFIKRYIYSRRHMEPVTQTKIVGFYFVGFRVYWRD